METQMVYILQQQITGQLHIKGRSGKKAILIPVLWFLKKGKAGKTTHPNRQLFCQSDSE